MTYKKYIVRHNENDNDNGDKKDIIKMMNQKYRDFLMNSIVSKYSNITYEFYDFDNGMVEASCGDNCNYEKLLIQGDVPALKRNIETELGIVLEEINR